MSKVLFVAPHPDDETLGCGGTILKYKNEGHKIFWLIVTSSFEDDGFDKKSIEEREKEIIKVKEKYGFQGIYNLNYRTTFLETYPRTEIIKSISAIIDKTKPDILFIPNGNDVHSDHRVINEASWSSSKSFRKRTIKEIYSYETVSETEFAQPFKSHVFIPNVFCDISEYISEKLEIMKIYNSEIKPHPFPRSLENLKALAMFRGATAGVKFAEAFMCLKRII